MFTIYKYNLLIWNLSMQNRNCPFISSSIMGCSQFMFVLNKEFILTFNVFKAKYKLPIYFLSICQFCKICEYFQSIVNMPASPIMAWGCSEAQKYLQSFRHKAASIEFFILHCYRFLLYFFLLPSFLYIEILMKLKEKIQYTF